MEQIGKETKTEHTPEQRDMRLELGKRAENTNMNQKKPLPNGKQATPGPQEIQISGEKRNGKKRKENKRINK